MLYSPIVYVTYEYAEPVNQYQSAEVHTHSRTNPYLYNQVKYEPKLKIVLIDPDPIVLQLGKIAPRIHSAIHTQPWKIHSHFQKPTQNI